MAWLPFPTPCLPFFFFFKSLNSAFWNLRMKMLNFSYGDYEKFMLWKCMTHWWLFCGSLSCNTLSTGQGARAQGPRGAPEIRKGTSISSRWHFPSLVVARLSSESWRGLCSSAPLPTSGPPHPEPGPSVVGASPGLLECLDSSQGSSVPAIQGRLFVTGCSIFQSISAASRSSLRLESTELHSSVF